MKSNIFLNFLNMFSSIHGWVLLIAGVFGFLTNTLNTIVLSRPNMINKV